MEINIKIIGVILFLLALAHVIFPKYFKWETELPNISLINRQMMYVHTFFIALTLLLMSLLCLTSANELIETRLGDRIDLGLGIFWTARLLIQIFGYSSELWKGKRKESIIHIIFTLLWVYMGVVFFMLYFGMK
jgi:hypothetical protein